MLADYIYGHCHSSTVTLLKHVECNIEIEGQRTEKCQGVGLLAIVRGFK